MLITDPIDWQLDLDGDLVIPLRFTRGMDGVVQAVRIRLSMFRGEWFLDLEAGIPYLERPGVEASEALLGQKFSETKALASFRTEILDTPGIVKLLSMSATFEGVTRTMTVRWQAKTAFGDTPLDTLSIEI